MRNVLESVDPKLELGAYLFPPSLSRLVGQDYERLLPYLDLLQPMLYRLGEGVACLNYELAALAEEVSRLSGAPLGECLELAYRLAGVLRLGQGGKLAVEAGLGWSAS